MESKSVQLAIVGSGPAGLTAAIYAARAGLKPFLIAGYEPGGQLMQTTIVENYPGFVDGIDGPELMANMIAQAEKWGTKFLYENVKDLNREEDKNILKTDTTIVEAKSVIFASGALPRRLNVKGEAELWGRGVSSCATCDGALYKDKVVAVIGGGDSAMEEASFLTKHASKVYIVHRRKEFKASKIMQDRVLKNPKIEIIWNKEVEEIVGKEGKVDYMVLKDVNSDENSHLDVDGMFLAIGHIPVTEYLKQLIKLDSQGYVLAEDRVKTGIPGVFVAGDIEDKVYRQAVTAAGFGAMAGISAQKWLEEN